jgi:VWFA-related protein
MEGLLTARRLAIGAALGALMVAGVSAGAAAQRNDTAGPLRAAPPAGASEAAPVTIRINAVVTDSQGRPVVNLQPGDFQFSEGGVERPLASVSLRKVETPAGDATPVLSDEDEQTAARDPNTRVFALFLDDFNVSPGVNSSRVREAASRFLAEQVRLHDLLHVMRPMTSLNGVRFTRDRARAREAIDSFEGRKGDYAPRTSFETEFFGRMPSAVEGARMQIVTTGLRELTMRIGELRPARGAIILVSERLARTPGAQRRRLPDWQGLGRAASHFDLPIYTFDPGDPPPPDSQDAAAADPGKGSGTEKPEPRAEALDLLAAQTGGEAFTGERGLQSGFARLSRDLDSSYELTYQPSQPADGRFHPITVTTKRKGTSVRVPSGYWSPLSTEWRTRLTRSLSPPAPSGPPRVLRMSRLIDTWYGFEPGENGRLDFVFTWEETRAGAALRSRPHSVMLKVSTPDGQTLLEQEVQAVPPPGEETRGDRVLLPLTPGRVQLDMSIRSIDGAVLDTSALDVQVPAARGEGPVLLQPQIVRARTARDFRLMVETADAPPTPSRTFSRTERLLVRVPAYNPDGAPVTTSAAVSNIRGQTIRKLEPLPPAEPGAAPQFDLPLAFLAPGDYGIEVTATSPTGTARQLIRFRLTG